MKKAKVTRKPRTKLLSRAVLTATLNERDNELEWAKKLIGQMQGEIERMIKLNASLTDSINNLARKID